MTSKISKTPMCCGPVCDGEAMYLCMSPASYQCYCGKCSRWYTCEIDKENMNAAHIKAYGSAAKWRTFLIASQG